jgi:hypothetical protein
MLAIMLLSVALPSLACLSPVQHSACCRQMMEDCGSSMATASPSCCNMRSTDTTVPPALASQPESNGLSFPLAVTAILTPVATSRSVLTSSTEEPPGDPVSYRFSILRI